MILISAGRRVTADTMVSDDDAANVRKFYTLTVTRLSWKRFDLAAKYNATCDTAAACIGMVMDLATGKQLVLSASEYTEDTLQTITYDYNLYEKPLRFKRLVTVSQPLPNQNYEFGDVLLPHNVAKPKTISFDRNGTCSYIREDRQETVLNNHFYIESTLQTSYMAGLFFLFQNGGVKDVVQYSATTQTQTLAFDGNVPITSLWVSIPTSNALLTCIGCALLVLIFFASLIQSCLQARSESDPLKAITTPHVIARVMLDDNAFPTSVVRRRVVYDPDAIVQSTDKHTSRIDNFHIRSLSLMQRDDNEARPTFFI